MRSLSCLVLCCGLPTTALVHLPTLTTRRRTVALQAVTARPFVRPENVDPDLLVLALDAEREQEEQPVVKGRRGRRKKIATTATEAPAVKVPKVRGMRLTAEEDAKLVQAACEEKRVQRVRLDFHEQMGRWPTAREWAERAVEDGSVATLVKRRERARDAKGVLIEAYGGLVRSMALRYLRGRADMPMVMKMRYMDDLVQEGILGFIHAVERFQPDKGARLATYTTYWIRVYIAEWLRISVAAFQVPRKWIDLHSKEQRVKEELEQDLDREPTLEELSSQMNVPRHHIERARNLVQLSEPPFSLDTDVNPVSGDDEPTLAPLSEIIEDEDDSLKQRYTLYNMRLDIIRALEGGLTSTEIRVVRLRYGLIDGQVRTCQETADLLGMSKQFVSATCLKGFRRLRGTRLGEGLLAYMY